MKAGSIDTEVVSELILSGTAMRIMAAKREAAVKANELFDRTFPKFALGKQSKKQGLFPFFRKIPLPPSPLSGPEAEEFFRKRGIAVMHSCRFAVGKARQQDFLRISLSSVPSERKLNEGLERLKRPSPPATPTPQHAIATRKPKIFFMITLYARTGTSY